MNEATEAQRDWASAARAWWRALQPYDDEEKPNWTSDRGALARLRRAYDFGEMAAEEMTMDLYARLGFRSKHIENRLEWVAALATMLASVTREKVVPRNAVAAPFCRALGPNRLEYGRAKNSEVGTRYATAFLKPLRLRRLTQAREPLELARQMRRAISLLPRTEPRSNDDRLRGIDVGELAADILMWPHPEQGDKVRARWLYQYIPSSPESANVAEPDSALTTSSDLLIEGQP